MNRRDTFRLGLWALRGLIGLVVAVPGVAFLVSPLLARKKQAGAFAPVARLGDLTEGVPRSFPVVMERQDAWVKYPPEAVGTVWLIRQPAGAEPPVLALSAECPHLACQIKLAPNTSEFLCPCHNSHFDLDGERINKISPRAMDGLEVGPLDTSNEHALVTVKFQRFRTMSSEKVPLG